MDPVANPYRPKDLAGGSFVFTFNKCDGNGLGNAGNNPPCEDTSLHGVGQRAGLAAVGWERARHRR